jgi:hypothetical protein
VRQGKDSQRGVIPPFGTLLPVKDRQREAGRDFTDQCRYYFETVNRATSKNVIPAPILIGINSSRNPEAPNNTELPLVRE